MEDKIDMQRIIKLTLIRIGIKCDLVGFSYLVNAVELAIEDPMLVYNLKKLFVLLAKRHNIQNPFRVEANIQNAITLTYNTKGFSSINEIYGIEIFKPNYKPTTAEIIKLVAEYYNLGLYKNAI